MVEDFVQRRPQRGPLVFWILVGASQRSHSFVVRPVGAAGPAPEGRRTAQRRVSPYRRAEQLSQLRAPSDVPV